MGSITYFHPPFISHSEPTQHAGVWTPDPSWQMENHLEKHAGTYAARMGCILTTGSLTTNLTGAAAYMTSDAPGDIIPGNRLHQWTDTNTPTDAAGRKFRWIIHYYNTPNVAFDTVEKIPLDSMYVVFDQCNLTNIACFCQTSPANVLVTMESFSFINGANISAGVTDFTNFCAYCYTLRALPESLDVSHGKNFSRFCFNCCALRSLSESLNVANGVDFSNFCFGCYSLQSLPKTLDVSSGTNFNSFCYTCFSLQFVPENFNVSNGTNFNNFCFSCVNLIHGSFRGVSVAANISTATRLSADFLIGTIRALPTVSTARTLTVGTANFAKINTDAYKQDLTNAAAKGWLIA